MKILLAAGRNLVGTYNNDLDHGLRNEYLTVQIEKIIFSFNRIMTKSEKSSVKRHCQKLPRRRERHWGHIQGY